MDISLERVGEQPSNHPWLSAPPSSPRIGKVARPPRSPSTVTSPYSAPSTSKKRPSNEVSFPDIFSIPDANWPADPIKRPGHRRSASDSMAFLDSGINNMHSFSNMPSLSGEQDSIFEGNHSSGGRPLNGFGEVPDPDSDNVMAMFLDMDAIHDSLFSRGEPESIAGKHAPKHRRGASEGGISNSWLANGGFVAPEQQMGGLASVREAPVPGEAVSMPSSRINQPPKRRGHQRTFSEPPTSLSEETSFASEEDIKPCISGSFLDGSAATDDNRLVGLSELKKELGISGPLKESELELLQMDPRKAKRVLANRQSAQKSRIRKLHYISDLEKRVTLLEADLKALQPKVVYLDQQRTKLNGANSELKQKIAALQQETGFKDALNDALQKEVERLRRNIASSAPLNGRSGFQLGSDDLPSHHAPFAGDSSGPGPRPDANAPTGEAVEFEHVTGMDFGQSRDSFQHYLDDFNTGGSFLLDSL
ncbi:protein with bZIP transcription factor domain [Klebsormidium nitens]|uniref:Protein with bZIP transcription factor domain n=1 Tax=Klebsormidium nitens TaxID=105231 RepID=A0A1Y1I3B5_KLENI|nr:protein with bZIP transcription factor domain [Klebsormidium nitens]|eukprot:GAQ84973.1 protein with bZIP transcription factor domain [Klebsormidium nitens]